MGAKSTRTRLEALGDPGAGGDKVARRVLELHLDIIYNTNIKVKSHIP